MPHGMPTLVRAAGAVLLLALVSLVAVVSLSKSRAAPPTAHTPPTASPARLSTGSAAARDVPTWSPILAVGDAVVNNTFAVRDRNHVRDRPPLPGVWRMVLNGRARRDRRRLRASQTLPGEVQRRVYETWTRPAAHLLFHPNVTGVFRGAWVASAATDLTLMAMATPSTPPTADGATPTAPPSLSGQDGHLTMLWTTNITAVAAVYLVQVGRGARGAGCAPKRPRAWSDGSAATGASSPPLPRARCGCETTAPGVSERVFTPAFTGFTIPTAAWSWRWAPR